MRTLFLAVHTPDRAPGQRYRLEHYLGYFRQQGMECDYSGVLDDDGAKTLYAPGNVPRKALVTLKALLQRAVSIPSLRKYDLVFVQREALFIGGPFVERAAKLLGAKLVYDFDDAIWLNEPSQFNRRFAWLKNPNKVPNIMGMSDLVIAGNDYLADYARRFAANVTVVPSTIDTDLYAFAPRQRRPNDPVCIGWTGSFSTLPYFESALPALRQIRKKYGQRVKFKLIGDSRYRNDELQIVGVPWNSKTEVDDLRDLDVGIMPLPNDQWTMGKCGMKGLQYMAMGIPSVMSPVGVNARIISPGVDGFLPSSEAEWVETLSSLVENRELRERVGAAGRRRVEDAYSVVAWRQKLYDLLVATAKA